MIRRQSLLAAAVASLAALFFAPVAGAQDRGAPILPIPYRAIVGLNPLGIPFDIGAFEAEGVILPGISLGAAASYSALGGDEGDGERDPRFASGDVKVRYYPGEVALRGFSVGLGLGVTRYSENRNVGTPAVQREAVTAPTISVLADYNFLLGARERFVVGTGIGAKRLLATGEDRRRTGVPRAYPFVRFVLGIAF
ncbi:MAG: hypothetical protein M3282_02355 [Gemmatimonadota bacterium]|nr:hypothetical protein [Gemmatimonadota bacterium]